MQAGGDRRLLGPLIDHFGETLLKTIDQAAIDRAAAALVPKGSPATRNRHVYTPVSAVLKAAGRDFRIKRPKGSRGKVVTAWLWPEQAFRIIAAAEAIDREFALLLLVLCYTGVRLGDALSLRCADVRLAENFLYVPQTKNGDPRPVYLPPHLAAALAAHPRGTDRGPDRLFRYHKGGALYYLLEAALMVASGLPRPARVKRGKKPARPPYDLDWVNFHTFCHTWVTWMRRYAGLDVHGLVATRRWRDPQSAARYTHVVVSEEARKAVLLPVPGGPAESNPGGESVEIERPARKALANQ